uniref:NADH-ubiquinone oxidoreductase chain 4 n=1 Tax=Gonioctena intermedia TaxID=63691 RepID=A0A1L5IYV7_GONIN|nr:NADH dehydrogenase subunit 4 [Gonioctena intermedia]APM86024.1 NADH dehydrogenase subunit 4 [Gonioctena intermedia]AVX29549.1 NADH dehydrogenase subunit 4 [Gonioctena intermedia]AVX29562.1 NADH dehydrogenase subunit 4 [Gonioctena intermedia]
MMKFIFSLLFMIPLCFLNYFWLMQWIFFLLTFMFMMNFSFNYMFVNISYMLGMDLLSFMLILLSFWICSLMIMASEKLFKLNYYYNLFMLVMVFLLLSLYLTFSSMNLFIFYLFFEISLIPTLILIIGWGYQPERVEAGIYLLFYTLLMSLPMMILIFYLYMKFNSLAIHTFSYMSGNLFMYLCMNMVFFVKVPMFFVHLWLPKAHVEAPIAGSMILAGIMLKLGGYGLLRFMVLFTDISSYINIVIFNISLIGGFFVSLICIRQSDMKSLIAYSSVSHMGLVLSGIMSLNLWGFWGALTMMLAHGLCSSGLFCLANISYERLYSRSLYLNKGLLNLMPSMALWWFLLCSSNMAAPPSMNLFGEILLINSLVSFNWMSMIFLSLLSFFSAVYSLFLYSYVQHGKYYSGNYSFYQGVYREFLLLFLHWFPLNLLILKGEYFSLWV